MSAQTAPTTAQIPTHDIVPVEMGPDQRLIYRPYNASGDTILNFSHCGYGGGGIALPSVPVKMTLAPIANSKDDTARVQKALDELSKRPRDANGFRGALLLKRGIYRLSEALSIGASGVVLRGEGKDEKGTVLWGISRKKYGLISILGGEAKALPQTEQKITNAYVPVGADSFTVANGSAFKPGDTVFVTRHSNDAWIHEIKMDQIPLRAAAKPETTNQWKPFNLVFDRVVTKVQGNTLTVDAPIGNSIDEKWGGGSVAKSDLSPRITQVGVENLFAICDFDRSLKKKYKEVTALVDEEHVGRMVSFEHAQNVWARDLGTRYLQGVVSMGKGTKHATVQDCYSVEPISLITGGRRYPFFSNGQLTLWQRLKAQGGRHSFVYDSRIPGPNVFLDCVATDEQGSSEAHHRWSVGGLYDNVKGNVAVNDRGNQGSGQGWGGANYVIWNGEGNLMLQSPPTAQNFAFGFVGTQVKPRSGSSNAWWESYGKHIEPRSLYLKQLEERLGIQAVKNIATTDQIAKK